MFVLDLEDSIVINKPLEDVFTYMDDIEREHEWQPYLLGWEQTLNPKQNGVGSIHRYDNRYMGRSFTNEYEVTVYEPLKRVMYVSTPKAAVHPEGGTLWERTDEGTKVTFLFKPQLGDFWGLVPEFIVRRIYLGTLSNNMRRPKEILES